MYFRNMNVSIRAALGFGMIGVILMLLGLFAVRQMALIRSEASEVSNQWLPSITALAKLNEPYATASHSYAAPAD
jgi:methyl-accepting chemotaxis protein